MHMKAMLGSKVLSREAVRQPTLSADVRVSVVGNRARDLKWPPTASALEDQPAP